MLVDKVYDPVYTEGIFDESLCGNSNNATLNPVNTTALQAGKRMTYRWGKFPGDPSGLEVQ